LIKEIKEKFLLNKLHNKWVAVRPKEQANHNEFTWVRLLDIERVTP
jgi:hypothetical protein